MAHHHNSTPLVHLFIFYHAVVEMRFFGSRWIYYKSISLSYFNVYVLRNAICCFVFLAVFIHARLPPTYNCYGRGCFGIYIYILNPNICTQSHEKFINYTLHSRDSRCLFILLISKTCIMLYLGYVQLQNCRFSEGKRNERINAANSSHSSHFPNLPFFPLFCKFDRRMVITLW